MTLSFSGRALTIATRCGKGPGQDHGTAGFTLEHIRLQMAPPSQVRWARRKREQARASRTRALDCGQR